MGETGRPEKRVRGALGDFCIRMNNLGMNRQLWKRKKWRIPGTGEPGALPSLGLHRVRHN